MGPAALRFRGQGHRVSASVVWWPQLASKMTALTKQGINVATQERPPSSLSVVAWQRLKSKLGMPRHEAACLRRRETGSGRSFPRIQPGRSGMDDLCRQMNVPYAAVIQCNSETWWPTDDISAGMAAAYRGAKKVFCVSRRNRQLLECQIGEPLPNAVAAWNPFNVPATQPPPWPRENGAVELACVARLEPVAKGQDLLFQVLAQEKWRGRSVEVNLFGAGAGEKNLKKLAENLGLQNVRFRGHTGDVRKIWEENHLLALPSRYEGLPLVLVEAMWCGRPAVVTDVGGNCEICLDGETGFVAAAPAVGLLDSALERAWERRDEWQNMGRLARCRAEQVIPKDPVGDFCKQLTECL